MPDRRHRWTNLAPAPAREGVRTLIENVAEPELLIYDYIDEWGGEWGVSNAEVVTALDAIGNVPALTVRLASPGGDYFQGVGIYNALVRHPANITVYVDSVAASAASVIAMAGNRVVMGMGAQLMIHEARVGIMDATADDLRSTAAMVDRTNDDIAGFYANRAGGDPAVWREAVRQETWYTAKSAVEAGLADEVASGPTREVAEPLPLAARVQLPVPGVAAEVPVAGPPAPESEPAEAAPVVAVEDVPPAEPAPLTSPLLDDDAVARIAEAVAERLAQRTPELAPSEGTPETPAAVAAAAPPPATPAEPPTPQLPAAWDPHLIRNAIRKAAAT